MKTIFLIFGLIFTLTVFGQKPTETTIDIKNSIDSVSKIYKKNVSSYFIHESRDSIVVKIYHRETQYGEEKLLLTTRKVKVPPRLSN